MKPAIVALKMAVFATLLSAMAQTSPADYVYVTTTSPMVALGSSVTVSEVLVSTASNVLGSDDLAFSYDSTRFSISNIQEGSLVASDFTTHSFNTSVAGILRASSASGSGNGISVSAGVSGNLLTFTLTALANAPTGGDLGNLNILSNFSTTTTNVSDVNTLSAIPLNPAPTNGYDVGVDSTLSVASASVPEPGSLTLVGIGCLGVTVCRRLWRRNKVTVECTG